MEVKKFKNTNSLYSQNNLDPFSTDSNFLNGKNSEKKNKLNKLFGIMNKFNKRCIIPLKYYHNYIEFEFSFCKLDKIINSFKKKRLNKAFVLIQVLNEKKNNKNFLNEFEKQNNFFIRAWKIKKRNILNDLESFKLDTKERLDLLKNTITLIDCLHEITSRRKENYFTVLLLNYRREMIFERNQNENLVIDNSPDRFDDNEKSFENLGSSEDEVENDSVLNPEDYKDAFADTDQQEENLENSDNSENSDSEEFSENIDTLKSYKFKKKKKKKKTKKLSSSIYSSRSDLQRKSHNYYDGSESSYECENEKKMEKLIKRMIKKQLSKYKKYSKKKKSSKKGDRNNLYEIKLILKDLSKNLGKKGKMALRRYSKKFHGFKFSEDNEDSDFSGDEDVLKKKLRKLMKKHNSSDSDDEDLIGNMQKLMNDLENLADNDDNVKNFKKKKNLDTGFFSAELKNLCLTINILFKRNTKKILKNNFEILKNQRDRKISIMNGIKNLQQKLIYKEKIDSILLIFKKNCKIVLNKYFHLLNKKKSKKKNMLQNKLKRNMNKNTNPLLQSIKDNSLYDDEMSLNLSKKGNQDDFFYMNLEEEYNKKISMKKNIPEDSVYEK